MVEYRWVHSGRRKLHLEIDNHNVLESAQSGIQKQCMRSGRKHCPSNVTTPINIHANSAVGQPRARLQHHVKPDRHHARAPYADCWPSNWCLASMTKAMLISKPAVSLPATPTSTKRHLLGKPGSTGAIRPLGNRV